MTYRFATVAALLSLTLLSGCTVWSDQEFNCTGQDQISTWFQDADPRLAIQTERPMSIDFHLRGKEAMVKTFRAATNSNDPQQIRFHAQGSSAWITGVFERDQQQLFYVEERQLVLEGRTQMVRTAGHYHCQAVGGRTN